jgi:hypothetical protein
MRQRPLRPLDPARAPPSGEAHNCEELSFWVFWTAVLLRSITNKFDYSGPGTNTISATGMGTIANMGFGFSSFCDEE